MRNLNDLIVSSIGLGCMGMSEFYGPRDEVEAIKTIHYALDHGVNLLDTADVYGFGDNERLLAKALKGRRDQAVVATKCGIVRDKANPTKRGIDGSPSYIRSSVESSLRRLKVDVIDLFYLHRIDPHVPIEDSIGALSRLVAEGKIRAIGLSEASAATLRQANAVHPISALQSEYSMVSRDVEHNGVLATCEQLGIGFVAYSPLSRALLSEKFQSQGFGRDDFRQHMPRFSQDNMASNQRALLGLREFAQKKGISLAQLSLLWLLANKPFVVPIPGTKRRGYLQQNCAVIDMTLSPEELLQLNALVADVSLRGARYPDNVIKDHNLEG